MAIIKCKMCGGDLNFIEGASTAECEFCGSIQTIPKTDDEKKLIQFERAERLRKQCEFDKAAGIYETIVADFRQEAEAYWGLVLCKYGIEYVDDPVTSKKIPTCHRSSFDSIMEDSDFEQALENADGTARKVYRDEAKAIEEIRKGIIAVSNNEKPYDIFICYKETAENGDRTLDSVLAQDVYDALTCKGYRVFFSRITLEDKLGVEYEPYIFAALNSAKIMLAFGTDYEYFNAVWVKNEWSRFLKLMAKDKEKHLIPCYKGIDAYDMPKEFARLQAQDLGKVGAIQDLLRGIEKLLPKSDPLKETIVVRQTASQNNPTADSYLKRAFMFLEDGDWNGANEYCEKVLDIDPENALAYLGKLLAELKVKKQENLKDQAEPFDGKNNYQKAVRFADNGLKTALTGYIEFIKDRNENARLEGIYARATRAMQAAKSESAYKEAASLLASISKYKDASALVQECRDKAEIARKDAILVEAKDKMRSNKASDYAAASKLLASIPGWQDADKHLTLCEQKYRELTQQEEVTRKATEAKAKRNKKITIIAATIVGVILATVILVSVVNHVNTVVIPNNKYDDAVALMEAGQYEEAITAFEALNSYRDSADKIRQCNLAIQYKDAVALMESGEYSEAVTAFDALGDYHNSADMITECLYRRADDLMTAGEYSDAITAFKAVGGYRDSADKITQCNTAILDGKYNEALALKNAGKTAESAIAFGAIADYRDAKKQSFALWDEIAVRETISAGSDYTVGLRVDGTVVATGQNDQGQCNVSYWKNIVAISTGDAHTVGLRADGTVVAVGDNSDGQCNVSSWENIVAIAAGSDHTVGLRADGTVVAVGNNALGECNVSYWKDIVAISADFWYTAALREDGTVLEKGRDLIPSQKNTVAISAGSRYLVCLGADGTVVAKGDNDDGQCNVSGWKNIVAINAGIWHTAGLRDNGTVVAVGNNVTGQCNVSGWRNIVAISTGFFHTVGLRADGTVVAVGQNVFGACNVSSWKDIKTP